MTVPVAIVLAVVATAVAVAALLLVRRRAPDGGYFADGDRAAGFFGVLATSIAILIGFVVFLAFESFDQSRSGAENEARAVVQQFETAQFLPARVRPDLSGELVCYARYVVEQEWPRMEDGEGGDSINPWAVAMFRTLKRTEPVSNSEQSAYDSWLDRTAEREQARNDRLHGAEGVIPRPLWIVLFLAAFLIFGFMLLFADSGERALVQAVQIGSVVLVLSASLALVAFLNRPFQPHVAGLQTDRDGAQPRPAGPGARGGRRRRRRRPVTTAARRCGRDPGPAEWWVEVAASVLLALAAVATAWSGYQASQWHGDQALASGRATATRVESARASGLASRQVQIDVATFTQWVDAYARDDERARRLLPPALPRRVPARLRALGRLAAAA